MLRVMFKVNNSSNFPFGLSFYNNKVPLRAILAWNSEILFFKFVNMEDPFNLYILRKV